jgi:lipopolysaccharide transport system ATP-binding protein
MISLRAEGLGKAYRMYKRPIDSLKEVFLRRDYAETFWALRDATFEVGIAGSLGIIGDNGAGKSTLLKLLAGAASPTTGRVERQGRTSAILSLGAGFHPDLTGAENIRIGCAVLGLSPRETEEIAPRIVEFSELGSFIDRPVRTYSSGMHLRLGFSVATAVEPDVLIVDEHLSVGDQHFRHKCMRRIVDLRKAGCALVFCSHDLHSIREVCERSLWLRDGQPVMLAATASVVDAYQDYTRQRDVTPSSSPETVQARPSQNFLKEVRVDGDIRDGILATGGRLALHIVASLTEKVWREGVHLIVLIVRNDAVWCYGTATNIDGRRVELRPAGGQDYEVTFVVDNVPLLSGEYSFTVALMDDASPHCYDHVAGVARFSVRNDDRDVGIMRMPHRWE